MTWRDSIVQSAQNACPEFSGRHSCRIRAHGTSILSSMSEAIMHPVQEFIEFCDQVHAQDVTNAGR